MTTRVGVVRTQIVGSESPECPSRGGLLWIELCDRCGMHFFCEACDGAFVVKSGVWHILIPEDSPERVQ